MENIIESEKKFTDPIYKKWFRTKDRSGFISVVPWFDDERNIAKFNIDIGEADPSSGKLISSTNAFVDAFKLGTFLHSVANGSAKLNFGVRKKKTNGEWGNDPDFPTDESVSFYGGSGELARVFRIHYWQTSDGFDSKAFVFKAGHFEGRQSANGAIIPDMSKNISRNSIKVTRPELAEMSYIIDLEMIRR